MSNSESFDEEMDRKFTSQWESDYWAWVEYETDRWFDQPPSGMDENGTPA